MMAMLIFFVSSAWAMSAEDRSTRSIVIILTNDVSLRKPRLSAPVPPEEVKMEFYSQDFNDSDSFSGAEQMY